MAKGAAWVAAGTGVLLVYDGLTGKNFLTTVGNLLTGKSPSKAPQANPVTVSTATAASGNVSSVAGGLSGGSIETLWTSNGGAADTAGIANAIAQAESGGSATVTSSNPDGGTNVGVFQLDTRGVGAGYTVAELQNPDLNAHITIAATNNGRNWSEWGDPVADSLPGHQYTPGSPIPGDSITGEG